MTKTDLSIEVIIGKSFSTRVERWTYIPTTSINNNDNARTDRIARRSREHWDREIRRSWTGKDGGFLYSTAFWAVHISVQVGLSLYFYHYLSGSYDY